VPVHPRREQLPAQSPAIPITSNRPPTEWPGLFGDPLMASAALDRLADNASVLIITGASYRARDRQALYFPSKE
jgi:DNA replication protein DnaC